MTTVPVLDSILAEEWESDGLELRADGEPIARFDVESYCAVAAAGHKALRFVDETLDCAECLAEKRSDARKWCVTHSMALAEILNVSEKTDGFPAPTKTTHVMRPDPSTMGDMVQMIEGEMESDGQVRVTMKEVPGPSPTGGGFDGDCG